VRLPWPEDSARRAFSVALVCSVLLHVLLLGSVIWLNRLGVSSYAKKGEPLFVDMTPDKPLDRAPLGNPARPPTPPQPEPPPKAAQPPAPKPPTPKPKMVQAPAAPKASPPRPAPEPPKQVAKAAPSAPESQAKAPAPPPPTTEPAAPEPPRESPPAPAPEREAAEPARPPATPPGSPPSPGSQASGAQTETALARPPSPPPGIFRQPGGGGGLRGGRGGIVGDPIPLDTPDPNYRAYMEKVKQRIYAKWGYPYEAQTRGLHGKLVVEFHIAKDGHLQFIELRQSSGEEILDSFAMTAVKLAQLYPPLPDAMQRDVLPVIAIFVYSMRGPLSGLQSLQ
jgi:TonB family protein